MGDEPILPVIQPVTINTMLNNNGPNIGDELNFVTCERSFKIANFAVLKRDPLYGNHSCNCEMGKV